VSLVLPCEAGPTGCQRASSCGSGLAGGGVEVGASGWRAGRRRPAGGAVIKVARRKSRMLPTSGQTPPARGG